MRNQTCLFLAALLAFSLPARAAEPKPDYPVGPVPFTRVQFADGFWMPRLATNRAATVPYDFKKCEETGRIDNFAKAAKLMPGNFRGIPFDDSDVYKVIEGASYSLALGADPELDKYLDDLIAKIAAAQEPDGYLYTARTIHPDNPPGRASKKRWLNEFGDLIRGQDSHELYNAGHLYEAAVAHFQATGKRTLLQVALKNADLVASVWGPGKLTIPSGHQEIEIGLVKLYRVTADKKYLDLAKFLLDQRGRGGNTYYSDHLPVVKQTEAVGHAVRSCYMYAAMADVAALTGDTAYLGAIDRLWDNVVGKKLYLTGGVGARPGGEAFGGDYELPNRAYNETCAAIANALWNYRMFLLHGDAKYLDVLERILYNGFLSGVALGGDRFFYPNPLEADGQAKFNMGSATRQPWFDCACCPVNVVRFMPSIAGYVYATRGQAIYVNLFAGGSGKVTLGNNTIQLVQETRYPWDGQVRLTLQPVKAGTFALKIRLPGWTQGRPVPSDLYRYDNAAADPAIIKVNGKPVTAKVEQGFLEFSRRWKKGDTVEVGLPMPIRRVLAHEAVKADQGRVALERGPVVYCVEGIDHGGRVRNLVLADDVKLTTEWRPDLLGGLTVIRGQALAVEKDEHGATTTASVPFLAIPYYAWSHRGPGEMAVWLPRTP